MEKLPHEYLQSFLKDDIIIVFAIENNHYIVELKTKIGKTIYKCSEIITSRGMVGDHIRSCEAKMFEAINKSA